eukprot:4685727-Pleurochrysis_carterae.AAC.1
MKCIVPDHSLQSKHAIKPFTGVHGGAHRTYKRSQTKRGWTITNSFGTVSHIESIITHQSTASEWLVDISALRAERAAAFHDLSVLCASKQPGPCRKSEMLVFHVTSGMPYATR